MISNTKMNFKATLATIEILGSEQVILSQETADLLDVGVNDWVRLAILATAQ